MQQPDEYLELHCSGCGWRLVCGPADMAKRLQRIKLLRRDSQPEADVLRELFVTAGPKLPCDACGSVGLIINPSAELANEDWGEARACEGCGRPIPPERLEVFPDTRLCVACQSGDERGKPVDAPEYCPRCGAIMTLRQQRGAGLARYVMVCSECRR